MASEAARRRRELQKLMRLKRREWYGDRAAQKREGAALGRQAWQDMQSAYRSGQKMLGGLAKQQPKPKTPAPTRKPKLLDPFNSQFKNEIRAPSRPAGKSGVQDRRGWTIPQPKETKLPIKPSDGLGNQGRYPATKIGQIKARSEARRAKPVDAQKYFSYPLTPPTKQYVSRAGY